MSSLDILPLMAENSLAFKPLHYSICVTSVDICVTIEIPSSGHFLLFPHPSQWRGGFRGGRHSVFHVPRGWLSVIPSLHFHTLWERGLKE